MEYCLEKINLQLLNKIKGLRRIPEIHEHKAVRRSGQILELHLRKQNKQ